MWTSYPIQLTGGLVSNIPEIQHGITSPGSARVLVNFEPSVNGGYRRINGYSKWDTAVVPSTDSSTQLLGVGFLSGTAIVPREGKIYSSTGSGWTQIATGRTQPNKHRYCSINLDGTKKIIGTDGSNYPYSWDNTTFTNINGSTDLLAATYAAQFGDRIFYAVGKNLVYTEPFDEAGVDPAKGAGTINVRDTVTGLHVFRKSLFVFTENSIHVVSGTSPSNYNMSSLSETVGCINGDSVKDVGGDVFFLGKDGVRSLSSTDNIGDFDNDPIGQPVRSNVNDFIDTYEQFSAQILRGKSQYRIYGWDSAYSASLSEGFLATSRENTYEWAKLRGVKVYAAWDEVYNSEEILLFISTTEYVYKNDDGQNFDGTAIEASFFSPYLSVDGDPQTRKTTYKVITYLNSESTVAGTLSLVFDQNSSRKIQPPSIDLSTGGGQALYGSAIYGAATYSAGSNTLMENLTSGAGNNVSLCYSFTDDQKPFTIDTVVLEYLTEGKH